MLCPSSSEVSRLNVIFGVRRIFVRALSSLCMNAVRFLRYSIVWRGSEFFVYTLTAIRAVVKPLSQVTDMTDTKPGGWSCSSMIVPTMRWMLVSTRSIRLVIVEYRDSRHDY